MPDVEIARLVDRLMRRIHASLNAQADEFDTHQVGPHGGILLLTLAEIEPAPIQDLVRRMARDKSQMTRGVQALEKKGLIERRAFPDDARISLLALTTEGRATVGVLQHAVAGVLDDILSPLSAAEQDTFKRLLQKI
ncbi:MAG: MarR family transcriptional regulator [Pseudomonadota bacterium]